MKDNGQNCILQGYNAQVAVNGEAQVIVAAVITQQITDRGQLLPLAKRIEEMLGCFPQAITADAGYWDTESLADESVAALNLLVSPDSQPVQPGEQSSTLPANPVAQRMRERLASESGGAIYWLRKTVLEPVFGQIKERRPFRRFSFRGLAKVRAEWSLICLTHNLLKLFRHQALAKTA